MEEKGNSKQLLIKIKIPKLEGAVEERDGDDDDDLEEGEIREEEEEEADIRSKDLKTSLEIPNPNKDKIRVCPECNKEFSSGKALGGHMRIHNQQKQSNPHKRKLEPLQTSRVKKTQNKKIKILEKSEQQQQQPDYLSKCTDENGQTVCTICGKNFPSIKSLCGHMRCHPERYWRGILPPDYDQYSIAVHNNNNHCKSSSSSSLLSTDDLPLINNGEDGSVDDDVLLNDLPKWNVRAKRSRRVEESPEIEEEEEEEVQLLDAAEDLMRLANGDQSLIELGSTHKQQRVDEFEATNGISLTNKEDSALKNKKISGEMEREAPIQMSENDDKHKNLSDNELSSSDELIKSFRSNDISTTPNNKRRKKMKLMMGLESGLDVRSTTPPPPAASQAHQQPAVVGATTPDKFKCTTCNKSFPTHQALGGHRSSHNKIKITILNTVEDKEVNNEDNGSNEVNVKLDEIAKGSVVVASSGSATSTHQCTICNKVFPTGQALGGHKRCHWTGPVADQVGAPSSQVTHSSGEASQTAADGSRKVLEFDLNEEPPMEDEGGDNGNGDDISSSYNSNIG